MRKILFLVCVLLIFVSPKAFSQEIYLEEKVISATEEIIADTGRPTSGGGPIPMGTLLNYNQWLAAQFTTEQDYTITTIQGFIAKSQGETLHVVIYGDGGNIPNVNQEIHSQQIVLQGQGELRDWYGTSDLDWNLAAGTYWVAYEIREGDTYYGGMYYDAPNPLPKEASVHWEYSDGYSGDGSSGGHGWRIKGVPVADNEPPVAHAGIDIICSANALVKLDGSQSCDPDGEIVIYQWTRLPDQKLICRSEHPRCSVRALGRAEEVIQLRVIDNGGNADTDKMTIINRRVRQANSIEPLIEQVGSVR